MRRRKSTAAGSSFGDPRNLASLVVAFRERTVPKVSQARLAGDVGVSPGYIGAIENGTRPNIGLDIALMIAERLSLSVSETVDLVSAAGYPHLAPRWAPASAVTVPDAIQRDVSISSNQKELLLGTYYEFRNPHTGQPPRGNNGQAPGGSPQLTAAGPWCLITFGNGPASHPPSAPEATKEPRGVEASAAPPPAAAPAKPRFDADEFRRQIDAVAGRLTRVRLAAALERSGLPEGRELLTAILDDAVVGSLERGNDVLLQNIGILEVRRRAAVTRTDPRNGNKIAVPEKATVGFRPAPQLKHRLTATIDPG